VSVYYAIPSKMQPADAEQCLSKWRQQGYLLAIWRDTGDLPVDADLLLTGKYEGYHHAVNALCREILNRHPDAEWIVTGGDDMTPDPAKPAPLIAAECTEYFRGTFGIMQPTGDRWGEDASGLALADRICGSPWMGREFCRRMYAGRGPFSEAYYHCYGDEEMLDVARAMGILWQRRELTHYHYRFDREGKPMPSYLERGHQEINRTARIFAERKAAGFPGHQPIL